jgi:hypothetical protein
MDTEGWIVGVVASVLTERERERVEHSDRTMHFLYNFNIDQMARNTTVKYFGTRRHAKITQKPQITTKFTEISIFSELS